MRVRDTGRNAHKKQLADNLSKIDNIQSRLRSNVQSVEMLNQQVHYSESLPFKAAPICEHVYGSEYAIKRTLLAVELERRRQAVGFKATSSGGNAVEKQNNQRKVTAKSFKETEAAVVNFGRSSGVLSAQEKQDMETHSHFLFADRKDIEFLRKQTINEACGRTVQKHHLLGTPVLVFLLLPLVLSCKSTKTKEEIIQNYQHIIQLQLENILQPIECISTVSCTRLPKDIHGHLQNELQKLVKVIGESLGCPCSRHQEVKWPDSQSLHKKYCKLKRLLTTIQNAYEQHNSA
ncbi:hypothetical protein C0J45_17655 [Silurus meridionalis]|nr:hypothetical protein C0J45_17655 [Silurus meridionalis]